MKQNKIEEKVFKEVNKNLYFMDNEGLTYSVKDIEDCLRKAIQLTQKEDKKEFLEFLKECKKKLTKEFLTSEMLNNKLKVMEEKENG